MTSRGSRLAACVAALSIAACGPSVRWSGRSPDRALAVAALDDGGARIWRVAGVGDRRYDEIAIERLAWGARGPIVPARRGTAWLVADVGEERGPYEDVGPIVVAGAHAAYAARRSDGWHVVVDGVEGEAWDALADEILLDAESGAVAYVATRRGAEHVVWGARVGPPCRVVALLRMGAKGERVAYVDRGARDRLIVDHEVVAELDEVLELVLARDAGAPGWSAIVARGARSELWREGRAIASAPMLTHLRISDDGAHVACLAPSEDGAAIEVWLDGAAIARHRRVEGDALAFVPSTSTLAYVAEDGQGVRVIVGARESARYESIEGPLLARGRIGWIGRREGRCEVTIDGETIASEPWAGSLRLASEGTGFAYVARREGQRFVVTRRGRWPVPRFFVDTLAVDPSSHHWAALVPDVGAHRLEIWIDGEPRIELDEDELDGAIARTGEPTPLPAIRAIVEGELARATRE